MSYRTRVTYTRTSTDDDWYLPMETDFGPYLQSQYRDTGKIISSTITDSVDELTRTILFEWDSEASVNEFNADINVINDYINPRILYFAEHNITRTAEFDV
jgi:hypothetical protein